MEHTEKHDTAIKVSGIWLLVVGAAAITWSLVCLGYGLNGIVRNTWDGLAIFLTPPLVPGVLCLLAGVWTLKQTHWKLAIWFSGVSILLFGLTLIPTLLLAATKKEFVIQ